MIQKHIVDISMNWYEAAVTYKNKVPSMEMLRKGSIVDEDDDDVNNNTVFLPRDSYENILEIRDWLQERNQNYSVASRYELRHAEYETRKSFVGLKFSLSSATEVCLFKLFFS